MWQICTLRALQQTAYQSGCRLLDAGITSSGLVDQARTSSILLDPSTLPCSQEMVLTLVHVTLLPADVSKHTNWSENTNTFTLAANTDV